VPKCTIVVTAYLEKTKQYLDILMKSIENLSYPKDKIEVFIVSPKWYKPEYPNATTIHPYFDDYYNAHAINFGIEAASPDAEYFFVLNDDLILTRDCLTRLVEAASETSQRGIYMPIGNDMQGRYALEVGIRPGPYRLEEFVVETIVNGVMNLSSIYPKGLILADTLCLYAVLIPRRVFESVGKFDDSRQGQDDIDYTLRTRQAGFHNLIAIDSLVYHAGGVSADVTMSAKSREESLRSFQSKWGGS
jgi:GT2 family glycosyltransferase